eukprot:53390-Rhodomonas_salina.1
MGRSERSERSERMGQASSRKRGGVRRRRGREEGSGVLEEVVEEVLPAPLERVSSWVGAGRAGGVGGDLLLLGGLDAAHGRGEHRHPCRASLHISTSTRTHTSPRQRLSRSPHPHARMLHGVEEDGG